MTNINNLELVDETFDSPVDLEQVALAAQAFELLQPGRYIFKLPAKMDGQWPNGPWDKVQTTKFGERISLVLRHSRDTDQDFRLISGSGKKVSVKLSNVPIGKRASALDQLLAALGFTGKLDKNSSYVKGLSGEAGAAFKADLIYTAGNKDAKTRYSSRPWKSKDGSSEAKPIPRNPDGTYPNEFVDDTGTLLRCFLDLENFGPVTPAAATQ